MVYSWQALGGPPGMPAPLAERIQREVAAALRSPEVAARLGDLGFDIVASTPAEFAAFQAREIARWTRVVQTGGIKPE